MPNELARLRTSHRRSRPLPIAPVIALAILAVGIAYAQQNLPAQSAPPAAPAAQTDEDAGAATSAPVAEADGTEEAVPSASPTPATAQGSPQRFEPTEKVRPDFDVAFPVDI